MRTSRERARAVIFEADTPAGRAFDVVLLVLIVVSVLLVMAESVPGFRADHADTLYALEWGVTVLLINVIVGSTMYVVEGPVNGFDSMFTGVYWSIVTMSTVGFR